MKQSLGFFIDWNSACFKNHVNAYFVRFFVYFVFSLVLFVFFYSFNVLSILQLKHSQSIQNMLTGTQIQACLIIFIRPTPNYNQFRVFLKWNVLIQILIIILYRYSDIRRRSWVMLTILFLQKNTLLIEANKQSKNDTEFITWKVVSKSVFSLSLFLDKHKLFRYLVYLGKS